MTHTLQSRPRLSWLLDVLDSGAPRPAILMLGSLDHPLGQALVERGLKVLRTTNPDTALELVRANPPLLMILVRMTETAFPPARMIADLHRLRPDLWIGMLGDDASKEELAAGYGAGATDLLLPGTTPEETAQRVIRSLPSPGRVREQVHRHHLQRTREHREAPLSFRVAMEKARRRPLLLGSAATLGIAGAILLQLGLGLWDHVSAGAERVLVAIEGAREVPDRMGRELDRLTRAEELQLKQSTWEAERRFREREIEETRLRDLFRNSSSRSGSDPSP